MRGSRHLFAEPYPWTLGSARPLDFGHWAAHKLESITSNRIRHGEAVAIGMALDIRYARSGGVSIETFLMKSLPLRENHSASFDNRSDEKISEVVAPQPTIRGASTSSASTEFPR